MKASLKRVVHQSRTCCHIHSPLLLGPATISSLLILSLLDDIAALLRSCGCTIRCEVCVRPCELGNTAPRSELVVTLFDPMNLIQSAILYFDVIERLAKYTLDASRSSAVSPGKLYNICNSPPQCPRRSISSRYYEARR